MCYVFTVYMLNILLKHYTIRYNSLYFRHRLLFLGLQPNISLVPQYHASYFFTSKTVDAKR